MGRRSRALTAKCARIDSQPSGPGTNIGCRSPRRIEKQRAGLPIRSDMGAHRRKPARETTEPRYGNNSAACIGILLDLATSRRSLGQRKMSSIIVIIMDVLVQQSFQMPFIEHNHMVEQIPTAVTDPTLGRAVLPRAAETASLGLDAKAHYGIDHFIVELRAAIKDQIAWGRVVRERLAQLLNNPRAGRMSGHIAVNNAPPVMRNHEEAIENAEGERWHRKEVHRGDGLSMVTQKS